MTGGDFGDAAPEDAWDPDDPVDNLVDNLRRRLAAIVALRMVDDVIESRLAWIVTDLEHVAGRIRQGRVSGGSG
jgi:hypothetical protein